jgi:hypothetical protein
MINVFDCIYGVHGFKGSFGAKLAIIWENEHFLRGFQVFNAFFVLNPEH